MPELADVNSDQQDNGLDIALNIDRSTAARLGLNLTEIDNTLYDAFGQRQVSTIYNDMNQYHVVMEVDPSFWQSPETLREVWVSTSGGALSGTQSSAAAVSDFAAAAAAAPQLPAPRRQSASSASAAHGVSPTPSSASAPRAPQASRHRQQHGERGQRASAASCTQQPVAGPGRAERTWRSISSPTAAAAVRRPAPRSPPVPRPRCRWRRSPATGRAPRRWRSITRARSSPPPFHSTCPKANRSARAIRAIQRTMQQIHVPISVHGSFAGTAQRIPAVAVQ